MITVDAMTLNGYGKTLNHDNTITLTSKSCPEDVIIPEYTKKNKNYKLAKIKQILTPSQHRVKAKCSFNDHCGSCQWQQIDYKYQLEIKNKLAIDTLKKNNVKIPPTQPIISMPYPWYFRNKVIYPILYDTISKKINIGYYTIESHLLVDINKCLVQYPIFDTVTSQIRILLEHTLLLKNYSRYLVMRANKKQTNIAIELVLHSHTLSVEIEEELHFMIASLNKQFNKIVSFAINFNPTDHNTILTNDRVILYKQEDGYIYEQLANLRVTFSSNTFFQTNSIQYENILHTISSYLKELPVKSIIDTYCGTGTIGLFLAQQYPKVSVIGIENNPTNITHAILNKELNSINNIRFITYDVESFNWDTIEVDLVISNPPRKGIDNKTIERMIQKKIKYIVYVSCSIETASKNIEVLQKNNYIVEKFQIYDMFPHTFHFESLFLMKLNEN